jgi:hypothetical protein
MPAKRSKVTPPEEKLLLLLPETVKAVSFTSTVALGAEVVPEMPAAVALLPLKLLPLMVMATAPMRSSMKAVLSP